MRVEDLQLEPFHSLPYAAGPTARGPAAELHFLRAVVDALPDGVDAIVATGDLQGVSHAGSSGPQSLLGERLATELLALRGRGALPAKDATAVLLAGDLHPWADEADVVPVWHALAEVCRWVVGVAGNHDAFGTGTSAAAGRTALSRGDCRLLDDDIIDIDGMRFGGLSGTVGTGVPWGRGKTEYAAALGRLAGWGVDVLISHDGPNVTGSSLAGWPMVRQALEAAPPTLLVRGHDPWDTPLATLANGTQVLNVESRVVVLVRG